jgi:hypothetical protein
MPDYNECHIFGSMSGHIKNVDCWCEPQGYWITGNDGEPLFVVEHTDNHDEVDEQGNIHKRSTILRIREGDPRDWITRRLDRISFHQHPPERPHPDDRPRPDSET